MKKSTVLTGVVLLESYWALRKKDMIDLISPFILYWVARTTSIHDEVNVLMVSEKVCAEFGYIDIPPSVIEKVLSRNKKHFSKIKKKYYLSESLDSEIERFENRKNDCSSKIDSIGKDLFEYLKSHCRRTKIKDENHAISLLQSFFSSFALQVGIDTLELENISSKEEVQFYIAQYIFEKKEKNSTDYLTIKELTKGFLLRTAIYLQGENSNISTAAYKNTSIFYDTPFILQLLGYQGGEDEQTAKILHSLLKKQGAKLYYFPQTEQELQSILTAYQCSLIGAQRSTRTLAGLDEKKYTFDGVSRLKKNLSNTLRDSFGVVLHEIPEYISNNEGYVEKNAIDIDEKQAIEYVKAHTKHYSDENLLSDVLSAVSIHRLRKGVISQNIEQCRAIFLTTNTDFTRVFNKFYSDHVGGNRVMPVITSFDLSAIAWVKAGSIDESIPERQLLMNAYSAMQPAPEILEKCQSVLMQLENEGKLSRDTATSLMADRVTQRELWIEYFPSAESIDEEYIDKLQKKQRERYIGEEAKRIADEYRRANLDKQREKAREIHTKAKDYAVEQKERYSRCLTIILTIFLLALVVLGIVGLIYSLESVKYTFFLIIFIGLSIVSIFDTVRSKGKIIRKWITKKANQYETKIFEKKLAEYKSIWECVQDENM